MKFITNYIFIFVKIKCTAITDTVFYFLIGHYINNIRFAVSDYFKVKLFKANIGTVLECQGQEEILATEKRLKEIDNARNDLVMLIASGGCDEDKLDSEFAKLWSYHSKVLMILMNIKNLRLKK